MRLYEQSKILSSLNCFVLVYHRKRTLNNQSFFYTVATSATSNNLYAKTMSCRLIYFAILRGLRRSKLLAKRFVNFGVQHPDFSTDLVLQFLVLYCCDKFCTAIWLLRSL